MARLEHVGATLEVRYCPMCNRPRPIRRERVEPFTVEACSECGHVHGITEDTREYQQRRRRRRCNAKHPTVECTVCWLWDGHAGPHNYRGTRYIQDKPWDTTEPR